MDNPPEYPFLAGLEERILGVWNGYLIAHVTQNDRHLIRLLDASNPDALVTVGEFGIQMMLPWGITTSGDWGYLYAPANNVTTWIINLASLNVVNSLVVPGGIRNVLISGNRAFASTGSDVNDPYGRMDRLRIYDISDPAAPIELGTFGVPGWRDSTFAEGELAVVGDYVFALERDFFRILDTSDPANIVEVGRFDPIAVPTDAP
jgi:hypothetical protein